MLEMSKNHLQYPFATFYDHLHKSGSTATSMPAGLPQTTKLPVIPSSTSPEHKSRFGNRDTMGAFKPGADFFEADDKMTNLDNRLNFSEKSNRALLEEVIRLHGELRAMIRRNEEDIKDERLSRQQVEASIEMVNNLISALSARIKVAEEKIMEEKSALSSLVTHTKGVEQAVVASQHDLSSRKDMQATKIQELTLQLSEIQRNRDQVEKLIYNLTEELRLVRVKVDTQSNELTATVNDLKLRARRLEEENKVQLDALRKQGTLYSSTESVTTQLRGQMENRISELRDVIMELRSRQDLEATERRALEQQIQIKINILQENLVDQTRKREEALHAIDKVHREKEHSLENDKLRLQGKLTETVEEMNKRLLTKEIKLREELQEKYTHLEKLILSEQQIRHKYESTIREENEKRWLSLKKLNEEEMVVIKETFQSERQKSKEAIQKLDESITLIEKQLAEQKKQTDKVVAAEIKSRKHHEKSTNDKLDHLNEKLSLATASLQTAIGGVTGNFASHTDKLKSEIKSVLVASEETNARHIADIDVKIQGLKQKLYSLEQHLDGRISEATAILAQNLREKVESISLWQDVTSQTIRELNQSIQDLPNDIFALEEKQKLFKSDMDSRLTTETDARIRDVEALRHEISLLRNRRQPHFASVEDMQEVQASVRKLAETVQTVKTVISMKIQSEQKVREDDIKELQEEIDRLRRKLDPAAGNKNYPRNYTNNNRNNEYADDDDDRANYRDNGRNSQDRDDNNERRHDGRDDPEYNDRDGRGLDDRTARGRNDRDQLHGNRSR